jgi:hypothetical protein
MIKMKQITCYFLSLITVFALNRASAQEIRTSEGVPKIGDFYQNAINLGGKRRLVIPDGRWEVNNVFDDKEANWHASWKVVTLINRDASSPFRMTVIRYFNASVPRWPAEDCEKKSNVYAFGHDLSGSKGSRSICSNFFYWSNPQELIKITLPRYYNFYWAKVLSKLPSEFIQGLSKDQLVLEIVASQGGGLYINQDVLIDAQSIGVNAEDFKLGFSSIREGTNSKAILNWRTSYVQAVSREFLDSQEITQATYAFKMLIDTPRKDVAIANTEVNLLAKTDSKNTSQTAQKNQTHTVTESGQIEVAQERAKLENEKKILEERKQLDEERKKIEEEKKLVELEAIKRQKELLALQEERRKLEQTQLERLQEDKLRQEKLAAAQAEANAKAEEARAKKEQERLLTEEAKKREQADLKEAIERKRAADQARAEEDKRKKDAEAAALAEKRKQQEEEKRAAAELKKAEEEERKKIEAYKKSPPTIEVTQSEPDEFGAVILDIVVSKPTKSLTINGEAEGASKDGKYRVKRILKKTGNTNFTFVAIDEYGNKGASTFRAEFKNPRQPATVTTIIEKNQGSKEANLQIPSVVFDDCSLDFPHYLPHAALSLKKKNPKVSNKISAILAAHTARDDGKSSSEIRNGYQCNQASIEASQEYTDGAYTILFRDKKFRGQQKASTSLANSFQFFAYGGLKGVTSHIELKKPICFEVVHRDEHGKIFNSGFVMIDNIGFPKDVDSCTNKSEYSRPPRGLIEAIQKSLETENMSSDEDTKRRINKGKNELSETKFISPTSIYKSCDEFVAAFTKKFKFSYDYENVQCEATTERESVFVIQGSSKRVREGTGNIKISRFFFNPAEKIISSYNSDDRLTTKYQADSFIDVNDVSDMNDTKEITFSGLPDNQKRRVCEKTERVSNSVVTSHDFRIVAGYEVAELAKSGNWAFKSAEFRGGNCEISLHVSGVYAGTSYSKYLRCNVGKLYRREDGNYNVYLPEIQSCR